MSDNSDEHFKQFASALEGVIEKYGTVEDLYELQRQQLNKLVNLEAEFRDTLQAHKHGSAVYAEFVHFICETKKNILDARPYFRERQKRFTKEISGVFKSRTHEGLYPFRFNYRFILFVMEARKWGKKSKIQTLFDKITALRTEILEINIPLGISRARVFYSRTPKSHLSYMDLIQISIEGLMSGIDKYTPGEDGIIIPRIFRSTVMGRMGGNHISEYCLDQDTILNPIGQKPKKLKAFRPGDKILGVNSDGQVIETEVLLLHDHGVIEGLEITFDDGYKVTSSAAHKFLTKKGMVPLCDIVLQKLEVLCEAQSNRLGGPLSSQIGHKASISRSQKNMRSLSTSHITKKTRNYTKSNTGASQELSETVWVDQLLQAMVSKAERTLRSSEDLSSVSERGGAVEACWDPQVARIESRNILREYEESKSGSNEMGKGEPRGSEKNKREPGSSLAQGASGRECSNSMEYASLSQAESDALGSSSERARDSNLEFGSNSMWNRECGTKISRLCFYRSQDLGGSRRLLAFQHPQGYGSGTRSTSPSTIKGRDVESGSLEKRRCYVAKIIGEVFFEKSRTSNDSGRMAPMAFSDAPLSSTGNLVLRKIVRVRSVGPKRMYDLEVTHPKHNFLLPNGVVTSNSSTLIHFYPVDARKIYRANKAVRKYVNEIDFEKLAVTVNADVDPSHLTTSSEIADLMSAASCLSLDLKPAPNEEVKDKNLVGQWDVAPESARPDVQFENQEATGVLVEGFKRLTLFEQKFLRMKGISFQGG